jgi:hypothetical protein
MLNALLQDLLRRLPQFDSGIYRRLGWRLCCGVLCMLSVFNMLWTYCVLFGIINLTFVLKSINETRASASYFFLSYLNTVPGWLGPGAWLAYWITTFTAIARALRTMFGVHMPAFEDFESNAVVDADEVWDPDLTTSVLFTLFAWVALLAHSRSSAEIRRNLLVLYAENVAVVAGLCVGYLGTVFWSIVLFRLELLDGRLSTQNPRVRTALRRFATYGVLLMGSANVLLVFNLRMDTPVYYKDIREIHSSKILVYDDFRGGSIARLSVFVFFEFALKTAALVTVLAGFPLGMSLSAQRSSTDTTETCFTGERIKPSPLYFALSLSAPGTLGLGTTLLLMAIPGTSWFPNSDISILELDQLGPLVTVGLITAIRMFYLLRDWRRDRNQRRDRAPVALDIDADLELHASAGIGIAH